jgi:septal ring factor EnvC (AmiA/AmiB activator)
MDGDAALALIVSRLMESQREVARLQKLVAIPDTLVQCLAKLEAVERKQRQDKETIQKLEAELKEARRLVGRAGAW